MVSGIVETDHWSKMFAAEGSKEEDGHQDKAY